MNRAVATLEVPSELKEIDRIRRFLKKNLKGLPVSEEEHYQIELALVEICLNIIHYAYPGGKGPIGIRFWTEGPDVYLEIRDSGLPFDPTSYRTPDLEELRRQQKVGGLGIYLSRKPMDGFTYRRKNDQNILLIHKRLARAGSEGSV
ncbi:MAG: ATP-binding protein [Candidatus Saccharicenans sp.]